MTSTSRVGRCASPGATSKAASPIAFRRSPTAPKHCAVYCRVSTDERLDQSFNSIDAQKESGLAYVASQRVEGWMAVPDDYIDPGFSGGNMERPGLKRLMLNILLSFAQFEREVTGERIRDKIAASKAKGMHNRIYLGEILHKGKYYPGQHRAIIDQALWDAAHAVLAENNRQRASETWQRRQPPALLLGLFYTQDGERFQPAFTQKANGKRYRYYVPIRKVRFGANATRSGRLPAEPIEQLVLAQVHAALKAPEVVQAVCDSVTAATPEVTEPEVVLALQQLGSVWEQLFPAERQRIVQLLIERVTLLDNGIEITWRDAGWSQLVGELLLGTIGAELLELEQREEVLA